MDRRITAIKKDRSGNIVALCNPGESWSPRRAADVAKDIGTSERSYYVQVSGRRIYVKLISGGLQTTKDVASAHNLGNLPVC
jgi:hypothetical protein